MGTQWLTTEFLFRRRDRDHGDAMFTAALCWAGGFIISAIGVYVHNLWVAYFGYGLVGGCGLGSGYISPVSTLIKWFPDRPGMATGMAIINASHSLHRFQARPHGPPAVPRRPVEVTVSPTVLRALGRASKTPKLIEARCCHL
jgi:hypothetical protein